MLSSIYPIYGLIVLLVVIGSVVALVATTRDTAGGFGTKGDVVLAAVVLALAVATIGTSVL